MDALRSIVVTAVLVSGFAGVVLSIVGGTFGLPKAEEFGDALIAGAVLLFLAAIILPVAVLAIIKVWSWL